MGSFRRQHSSQITQFNCGDQVEKILSSFPELKNGAVGLYQITALQVVAAFSKGAVPSQAHQIVLFCDKTAVNVGDQLGRTPLHYAALNGNTELIKLLLDYGANIESKLQYCESTSRISNDDYHKWNKLFTKFPVPDGWGRTPLHEAVKEGHTDAVRLLTERNADVNAEDDQGVTPLLLACCNNENVGRYENILEILIEKGCDVTKRDNVAGGTALMQAVSLRSVKGVELLLRAGAWLKQECCVQTELHEAAANGLTEIVERFLDDSRITFDDVNRNDTCDRTPSYRAAYGGHKECLKMLIENGGDLGHASKIGETVLDIMFTRLSRPVTFIQDVLDSRISGSCFETENFNINLDFSLLARYGNDNQMDVITNILTAAKEKEKMELLQHPLIESYLHLKWTKIRFFFHLLIYIYVIFVLSLTTYIILFIHKPCKMEILLNVARYILITSSTGLLGHGIVQCVVAKKNIARQYEMWMNLACTTLSLIVATVGHVYSSDKNGHSNNTPNWVLHATSVAVLLAWFELMLLIGRSPIYGYYALMFAAVLQNVVKVNGTWALPGFVCDFYIAMDVTCSTSSIFNLVAISIDRYIAVTQPIKYAKHKNNRRVWLTIALVWVISAAIGSPIVLGLNNTPDRVADACLFYNSDFIIYSSLSSFYIPCIIMVFLYYNIFKALRKRAMQSRLTRKPLPCEIKPGSVIENVASTKRLAETALGPTTVEEPATNTGSGSGDEDEAAEADCHVISNDKSTEFILATVVEEAADHRKNSESNYDKMISSVVASLASPAPLADPNGNNDSGYAPSQPDASTLESPKRPRILGKRNGATLDTELKTVSTINSGSASDRSTGSKKEKKASAAARFTIYKVNKASRKKREKSSAKKERKATKTLAIVLGVFLICWVPFFTCNIMDAMCSKLNLNCQPGVAAFLLTTWLGYMNSFVNPVIYTIFNPEFRKAFKKLMFLGP